MSESRITPHPSLIMSLADFSPHRDAKAWNLWLPALLAAGLIGLGAAWFPPFAFLFIALAGVVLAIRGLEVLCVLTFVTLPYMVVNLPTGAFTLKLPEVVAYLFAGTFTARALLRNERPLLPPATLPVLVYLGVMALSAACSPPVAAPYQGDVPPMDRNSPTLRSLSLVIWLGLSWLVVTAFYNYLGERPALFRRCVRAHVLAGGLAALISLGMYALALMGMELTNVGGLGRERSLVPMSGSVLRLAGVAYEPLFLAFYLQTVIPVTLVALLFLPDWLPRWLAAAALVAQLLAMLLTFSAGGAAGLLIALLLLVPLWRHWRPSRRAALSLAVVVVVFTGLVGGIVVAQRDVILKFAAIVDKLSGGDEIRQNEWAAGYGIFEDYPVLGIGPGMAGYHFPRYHPNMQSQFLGGLRDVNNLYLSIMTDTGLVGMAAFGWCALAGAGALLAALRRRGVANAPALAALTASLVGCAVQYVSLNALFLIYFCVLIGFATAAARLAESDLGMAA